METLSRVAAPQGINSLMTVFEGRGCVRGKGEKGGSVLVPLTLVAEATICESEGLIDETLYK